MITRTRVFRSLPLVGTILIITLLNTPLVAQDVAGLYKAKCTACHGADGSGTAMGKKLGVRDFGSAEVQKMSDDELTTAIAEGKGKMPGLQEKFE